MINMLATLPCAIALYSGGVQQVPVSDWKEIDFLVEEGWQRKARQHDILYRRSSDFAGISIWTVSVPEQESLSYYWTTWVTVSEVHDNIFSVADSGFKIGDDVVYIKSEHGDSVSVRLGRMMIRVFAHYRLFGPPGNRVVRCDDPIGDIERVEGGARHAIAKLKALNFETGSSVTVSGHSVSSTLRDPSGNTFVSLDGWAQARNINLNKNLRRGTFAFSHGGRNFVSALGTDQIKVGSLWKSMSAMAVRKGETWYVPLNGIELVVE